MADLNITINGIPTVLTDTGAGYNIDLTTSAGRAFLRTELQELRAVKGEKGTDRDAAELGRLKSIARRDAFVDAKNVAIAEITAINLRINDVVAFLQGQGDDTTEDP